MEGAPQLLWEVMYMDIRTECLKVVELGYPTAALAHAIGRDPSTLNKWLKGTRNVSEEIENAVKEEILRLKNEWTKVME